MILDWTSNSKFSGATLYDCDRATFSTFFIEKDEEGIYYVEFYDNLQRSIILYPSEDHEYLIYSGEESGGVYGIGKFYSNSTISLDISSESMSESFSPISYVSAIVFYLNFQYNL